MAVTGKKAVNILIGVGGTGAKVVEAAMVQLLAGMVDNPVYVGLVDQDLANGNVARAVRMLGNQHRFRRLWGEGRGNRDNTIEFGSGLSGALGASRIEPLYSEGDDIDALYRPNSAGDSLHQMLARGLSKPQEQMFDMLFMNTPQEQHLSLDEGYRGRAHVGSAAFISALEQGPNKLWTSIERIAQNSPGEQINVFFIGSAFGGTGAAGFPTLARRLHRMREDVAFANAQNIRIGGLLMLPYFDFSSPEEEDEAVVTTDELLPKAKLALEYYHNLFKHERSFDRFYTIGWPERYPLGYHEPGANEQSNPALPPEMLGATSAIHFFNEDVSEDEAEETTSTFLSAHDDRTIDWRDIPSENPADNLHMLKMGQLLRFCVYWRFLFEPSLMEPIGGLLKRRNWAQKLAGKAHPADITEEMEVLDEMIGSILNWFAQIEATASRVAGGQNLWSIKPFTARYHDATPTQPVIVASAVDKDDWGADFDNLVYKQGSGLEGRTAAAIYEELINADALESHSGIGKAIVQAFEVCRLKEGEA